MSKYTDAEMMMATQIAYLDFDGYGADTQTNVGDLVDTILQTYGTYDREKGTYVMKNGVSGKAEAQFKTAQNICKLAEQNHVNSWENWNIVNSCDKNEDSGFYACLIDTGNGDAVIGFRGSESYNAEQTVKDWVVADVGRLNNPLTQQQKDATEYMEYLYKNYGDKYDSYHCTGHSLGGSLATHATITAPEGMQDKIEDTISFDGPGFSDEYLLKHAEQIEKVKNKLTHYEWSWVGSLLFQPTGINNKVIKAHDDQNVSWYKKAFFRHATENVEFDENGNVMDGERGTLQLILMPSSKMLEILLSENWISVIFAPYMAFELLSYLLSISDQILGKFEEVVEKIKEKIHDLYNTYMSLVVSGEYEIHSSEMCAMTEELETVQGRLNGIANEIDEIRKSLPYDSIGAGYYKSHLRYISNAITIEGKNAKKLSKVADKAVTKYNKGDQQVAAVF